MRRHYNDRYLPVVTNTGAPERGYLKLPPGPGLGVELKEEFLRSGKIQIESVDEKTADNFLTAWDRGESLSPKDGK